MLQIILPRLQPDHITMAGIILAGVIVLGIAFIRHALRHRKSIINTIMTETDFRVRDAASYFDKEPLNDPKENVYLLCFLCKLGLPIIRGKKITLRPDYHMRIRNITQATGKNEVTVSTYVDNVLRVHFNEYSNVIDSLYDDKAGKPFNKCE